MDSPAGHVIFTQTPPAGPNALLLTFADVTKTYPRASRPVLRGVSFAMQPGETLALTGESGSGKSTVLHLAGALDSFDSGEIRLDGQSLAGLDDAARAGLRRGTAAVVFQQFNLVPSLTVAQNLSLHARLGGREDPPWTRELAERLGLLDYLDRYPEQLSGGQQQRVAIGRAAALRPKLMLADEPTGNLDETAAEAVLSLFLDLVRDTGAGLLLVTHSDRIAARLDRRLHLSLGQVS